MKKAILFDMDMTLINSRPAYRVALDGYFRKYGLDCLTYDFTDMIGINEDIMIAKFCEECGIPFNRTITKWVFDEFERVADEYVVPYIGAKELLMQVKKDGYKIALATSTFMQKVHANFKASDIPLDIFDVVVSKENVTEAKPSPELFLLAAQKLKVEPRDCVVIEDAINGIRAAKSAGIDCICVENSFPREKLLELGALTTVSELSMLYDIIKRM